MSEYTQRYEHVSHKELYLGVTSGDPSRVDALGAQWSSLKDTLEGLSRDLSGDLEALAHSWTGDAAREFQRRLGLVVGYSGTLAEGMAGIRQALDMMATELRAAQAKAESPEETDDNDELISGATEGLLVGGVPGAVIGGLVGHSRDEAEREKAHQRMVRVVADLAEGYDFSAYGRLVVPEPPPTELPGDTATSGPGPSGDPFVGSLSAGPASGTISHTHGPTATTTGVHHITPSGGTSGAGAPGSPGAGTPGTIGSVGVVGPAGTSLAGAGPLLGGGPTVGGLPGGGVPGATSTVPIGGGGPLVGLSGTGSLAGSGTPATGRMGGLENRSAAGTGRLAASSRGIVVEGEGRSNGGRGAGGRSATVGRNGVLGRRGEHDEDESDERLTWLTEDEMVWGDGRSAPPPVLGTD